MQVTIAPEDFAEAFRRDWPAQYEITALRLVNAGLQTRVAELEAGQPAPVGEPTEAG